jgi:16S rRNA (uracil1498-N3)-methyltransferase
VPSVQEVSSTKQLIEKFTDYDQVILLDQNAEDPISKVYKISKSKILLIIGPEGGVSDAETAQFKNTNVSTAKLANSTFRSAHVALAATSAINTLAGNW